MAPPAGYDEARKLMFPNSKPFVLGGCLLSPETSSPEYYCEGCRAAEKEWQKALDDVDEFWKVSDS
ncbi:MAG: hypothetical protein ABIR33_04590 [Pyrinomonadaceae bacterium]